MRYTSLPTTLFHKNRQKILERLPQNAIAVLFASELMPRNGDLFYPYRQNSDFFYACGIEQELSILLFVPWETEEKRVQLYIREPNHLLETWEGKKLTKQEAADISGISDILYEQEFKYSFFRYAQTAEQFYCNRNENPRFSSKIISPDERFAKTVRKKYPTKAIHSFAPILTDCRLRKEPEEIACIQRACEITNNAFSAVLASITPGMQEFEIEAILSQEFIKHGACHAFEPIVASGKNACYLHYTKNNAVLNNGDMLLIDFGAEYANYASDFSRTIPVNGTFSKRQEEVYCAVLRVLEYTKTLIVPGACIAEYTKQTGIAMQEELLQLGLITNQDIARETAKAPAYRRYFMHGVSHFLGLDTHDVGGKNTILEPGMIVSCEPGIYILEEGLGIRLENDILVTETGNEDLSVNCPIRIEDITNKTR